MQILVVDDSVDSRLLIGKILEREGFSPVDLVTSAREAFARLGVDPRTDVATPYDLVIMDVGMPEIDGIEACRRILEDERMRDLPIVVVTASDEHDSLAVAFEAGAVDFLAKPLDAGELSARVRSVLRLKREMDRRKERERQLLEVTRRLEQANAELERLSALDALTGLSNRRRLDEFLDLEAKRAARTGFPISIVMVDIDCFKAYNDRLGHPAGDECLRRVAKALQRAVRRPGDLLGRYGGEEFMAILPGTGAAGALQVAEAMREGVDALRLPHPASSAGSGVTISVGVASGIPGPERRMEDVVRAADEALYRAKREGRNRVRAWGDGSKA